MKIRELIDKLEYVLKNTEKENDISETMLSLGMERYSTFREQISKLEEYDGNIMDINIEVDNNMVFLYPVMLPEIEQKCDKDCKTCPKEPGSFYDIMKEKYEEEKEEREKMK